MAATYENRYCWVIEVSNGRVCELREYMDTHAGFAMIFGDNPPGKDHIGQRYNPRR